MSVLTILQRNKRNKIKVFSRKCRSIVKDKKLSRSGSKTNKCTTKQIEIRRKKWDRNNIKIKKENFEDEEFPHKLLLTTRQTIKIRMPLLTTFQLI